MRPRRKQSSLLKHNSRGNSDMLNWRPVVGIAIDRAVPAAVRDTTTSNACRPWLMD